MPESAGLLPDPSLDRCVYSIIVPEPHLGEWRDEQKEADLRLSEHSLECFRKYFRQHRKARTWHLRMAGQNSSAKNLPTGMLEGASQAKCRKLLSTKHIA
jgi:hypothetical protein